MGFGAPLLVFVLPNLIFFAFVHQLLEKAGQFLVKACGSSCAEHGNFNQRLIDILHQKMEHPCWKDRDSAMELLQSLLELQSEIMCVILFC